MKGTGHHNFMAGCGSLLWAFEVGLSLDQGQGVYSGWSDVDGSSQLRLCHTCIIDVMGLLRWGLCTFHSHLTHWGRVTHICVNKILICSDNGLSPDRHQAIIWTNAGILLIGPLGTNFSEIPIENDTFSFKKIHLKMSSAKWRPFCLGLHVLKLLPLPWHARVFGQTIYLSYRKRAELRRYMNQLKAVGWDSLEMYVFSYHKSFRVFTVG